MTKVAARGNERGQRNPASRSGAEDLHRARRHVPEIDLMFWRGCLIGAFIAIYFFGLAIWFKAFGAF